MRAIVAGLASGAAAAVGVLLAFCAIMFLTLPAPDGQSGPSAGEGLGIFFFLMLLPTLMIGLLLGGIVLTPYAYIKSLWALDWFVDIAVLAAAFVPIAFVIIRQNIAPPIGITVTNGAFLLSGALLGRLPLKLLVR
jgi:hypothetical protein